MPGYSQTYSATSPAAVTTDIPSLVRRYVHSYGEELTQTIQHGCVITQQQSSAAVHSHLLDVKNEIQQHLDTMSGNFANQPAA